MDSTNVSGTESPLAIIGGSGKQGRALAARFAKAGVRVLIGSREQAKGENAASELNARLGISTVEGFTNRQAAARAPVVLLAVPYDGMKPILEDIRDSVQNKIVINTASALEPQKKSRASPARRLGDCRGAEISRREGKGRRRISKHCAGKVRSVG